MLVHGKRHIRLPNIGNYMGLLDKLKRSDPKEKNAEETDALIRQKNYKQALLVHEKYFDKENAKDWYIKAKILENMDNTKQALECYSKTVQLDESYHDAWFKLGLSNFHSGDFTAASNAFAKTSIIDNPIHNTNWNQLSEFYYMMSLYMQYLDSHDRQLRQKISREIKILRSIIVFNDDSEEKFLAFCSKNFKDIVKNLQTESADIMKYQKSDNN